VIAYVFLLLTGLAHARDVRLCGQWTPSLDTTAWADGDGEDRNGDGIVDNDKSDFLHSNDPLRTHGLLATMYWRTLKPAAPDPWSVAWVGYLTTSGPDGGCTPVVAIPVPPPGTVTIQLRLDIVSSFEVPDHAPMVVWDDDKTPDYSQIEGPIISHVSGDPTRVDVAMGSGDNQIDIAIILAWALNRETGGVTGMDYDFYNCPRPDKNVTDPNCVDDPGPGGGMNFDLKRVYVNVGTDVRRILHETGHAITAEATNDYKQSYEWRNAPSTDSVCDTIHTPPDPNGVPTDGSGMHPTVSDEATAAAILEGFATYYAAQTINRIDESDCFVGHAKYDWNHDGFNNNDGENYRWYSCEGAPVYIDPSSTSSYPGPLQDNYYWGEFCGYPGGSRTNGNDEYGLASEYDWTRFFWDMDTDYGHTFEDLLTVLAYADPFTWITEPVYDTSDPAYDPDDRPWKRMADGALTLQNQGVTDLYLDWIWCGLANGAVQ